MNNSAILEFQSFDLDSPSKDNETLIDIGEKPVQKKRSVSPDYAQENAPKSATQSFWTFEYYQQFFDVDTEEVKQRIIWSMVPRLRKNFLDTYIKPNPDLYGPIWICTTLVFTIAVSGNITNYMQHATKDNYRWHYDFHLISYAATAIFSYVCFVPFGIWVFMKWKNDSDVPLSFLELLCAYGYSLSVYVPASIMSTFQLAWLQWGLILLAASLSLLVLVSSLIPSVTGAKKLPVLLLMISLHYLLAIGLGIYFFNAPAYFTHTPVLSATSAPLLPSNGTNAAPSAVNSTHTVHSS